MINISKSPRRESRPQLSITCPVKRSPSDKGRTMSGSSNTGHSRNGSVPPSAPSSPRVVGSSDRDDQTEPLNIDALTHIRDTHLKYIKVHPAQKGTVVLGDKGEQEAEEVKVEFPLAQDILFRIGEKELEQYSIVKFLPMNSKAPAKMVTYCVTEENKLGIFLRRVGTPEPVVILPVFYGLPLPGGRVLSLMTVLVSESEN